MYWRVDNCSMVIPLSNYLSAILDFDSCSKSSLTNTNLRSASRIGTSSSRHGVIRFCMFYPFVQQDSKFTRSRNDCKIKLWRTAKVSFLNIPPRTVQQSKSLTIIHSVISSEALFLISIKPMYKYCRSFPCERNASTAPIFMRIRFPFELCTPHPTSDLAAFFTKKHDNRAWRAPLDK